MKMDLPLMVTILDIDEEGVASVLDPWGGIKHVSMRFLRAKSELPKIGEQWIIDKALGDSWTFAGIMRGTRSTGAPGRLDLQAGDETDPPTGYLWCDGSSIKVTDYPELYASIGSKYGTDGGMQIVSTGSAINHATDSTPTMTLTDNSAAGDLALLFIALPTFYGSGAVQSVSGLSGTWAPVTTLEINKGWGMKFEVWAATATGASNTITPTLSAKSEAVMTAILIRGTDGIVASQWVDSTNGIYSNGLGAFSLAASTPADLMVLVTAGPGSAMEAIEETPATWPWSTTVSITGGADDRPVLVNTRAKVTAFQGAVPVHYLVDNGTVPWVIGGVMLTPTVGQEPTFTLPNIPDETLSGQAARWMISTGRPVSLFTGV